MANNSYDYLIVGGGLAAASAVEGIRELDQEGTILLLGKEQRLPYHRPPLSKKLWSGEKAVDEIFVHDEQFYADHGVQLALGAEATALDTRARSVRDDRGNTYAYRKLLLATGGYPRTLSIPSGDFAGVFYYRYLDHYLALRPLAQPGKSALVIGGGFIGSEMAAALNKVGVEVTMLFPEPYLGQRVFPESLGRALLEDYRRRGVKVAAGDVPASTSLHAGKLLTRTRNGAEIESDFIVVGVGIVPDTRLAETAGLDVRDGILVNEYLATSAPDVYAAGDVAFFPYAALHALTRIEHWDNALSQGKHAGRNMAGAEEPFTYMPYFFSDLFDFGYEAVGDTDSRLETFADWQEENKTGVVYYLKEGKVRGAMMCNLWDKVDAARALILEGRSVGPDDLRGAIA